MKPILQSIFPLLSLFSLLLLLNQTNSLPSTFDIRYQPGIAQYSDFQPSVDYFCQAYSWAKQLVQVVSNAASCRQNYKMQLSMQHLVECMKYQTDLCQVSTMKEIEAAIQFLRGQGIVGVDCYPNRLLELPSTFCARKCADGKPFPPTLKPTITQETNPTSLLTDIGNGKSFGFIAYQYFDQINYYSPEHQENMNDSGELMGYGIGQIIGWRKSGKEIVVRGGAAGWGFKGYAYIDVASKVILKYYSVRFDDTQRVVEQ